ncbi:MAG: hypothetical protein KC561_13015, partial [Myxococcales bacterium]|nr:hypothetical protein [Myxococcales bacterium]
MNPKSTHPLRSFLRSLRTAIALPHWIRKYQVSNLKWDLVGGVTVGMVLVPQSMAYAVLAGLPPAHGLYGSMIPLLVYALLGHGRQVAFGIVAVDMLVVASALTELGVSTPAEAVPVVLVMSTLLGALHLVMGLLRFGWLVAYLSRPVVAGFFLAAPVLIALSQVGNLAGIEWPRLSDLRGLAAVDVSQLGRVHLLPLLIGGCS